MSQETGKFLYFKVGLLKDSDALDALWQDALKHHMVDHPDKLIALRLTEYYEIVSQGLIHPIAQVTQSTQVPVQVIREESEQPTAHTFASNTFNIPQSNGTGTPVSNTNGTALNAISSTPITNGTYHPITQNMESDYVLANENNHAIAGGAEKNAEEAADYWALL